MSLANQIVDFVDDVDKSLLKLIGKDAPTLMKTAQVLTIEEREKLEPDLFALVMHTEDSQVLKKFPITDAANTWLSAQYFEKTAEQLPYVAQKIAASNLHRACAFYKVASPDCVKEWASPEIKNNLYLEVRDMKKYAQAAPIRKQAQVESDGSKYFYALGDNYAMPSAEYVKKAAAYFTDHHREFQDAEDRHAFAANVLERAKELSVQLETKDTLEKYAGQGYGDSWEGQIRLRQELLQAKPEMAEALNKLASKRAETDADTFSKALYLFDKRAGLARYYDSHLMDAFKSTFGRMHKTAGYSWEDTTSGLSISEGELSNAVANKYDRIKSYFGGTLADSLKKHAVAIFDSLPSDAKETIVKIAKGVL